MSEGVETEHARKVNRLIGFVRRLPTDDWLVLGWVLAINLLLHFFAATSVRVFDNHPVQGLSGWLELFNHWDAPHYLRVAQLGYTAKDVLVFPLFPWCVRMLAYICGNYLISAFIVSTVASAVAAVLLRRLVERESPADARRTVWFFVIFPTAYFLFAPYTESLFLALAFGCLLAARRERWDVAGPLGAVCAMTRANGLALLLTLAVEAVSQFLEQKRWRWQWLWICVVPIGFVVYLGVNASATGNAFAFGHAKKEMFYTTLSWPWVGINHVIGDTHRAPSQAEIVGVQELIFIALGFVCTILSWLKLRPMYSVWMTVNWLGITSLTFVQSAPRYSLPMFPIMMLFALAARNRFWNGVITIWSLLFLALFSILFVRGWWAF
jgi:mannosyltransferase PIG-V